jgi:tetratricopeptide (TPR) repeat protein
MRQAITESRAALAGLLNEASEVAEAVADAYGRLGAFYHLSAVVTAAEPCYLNAIRLAPENFRWRYYLGNLLLANGRPGQALEHLQSAADIDGDYPPLRLKLGRARYELNRVDEAQADFAAAAENPGLEAMASFYLGELAMLRRDHRQAIELFQRVLELAPDADRVHFPLAQALRAVGDTERARAQLRLHGNRLPAVDDPLMAEMDALDRGARPLFLRAMDAAKRRDYGAASEAFAQGLEVEPNNVDARVSYARALYLAGQGDAARVELDRALAQAPRHALARFLLGILVETSGEPARAEALYRRTLADAPDHAGAHFYLAGMLFREGDFAGAARHYAAARRANPDNTAAALLESVALSRTGTPDAALAEALGPLRDARPDDPLLSYALARLAAASADPEVRDPRRALDLAQGLVDRLPTPPHVALLVLARGASGDIEGAQEVLRQLQILPAWMTGVDTDSLESDLAACAEGSPPRPPWPREDPLLQPLPVQAQAVMREYPAAVPF